MEQSDCKGIKDVEKIKCDYFIKKTVVNVKEMAERIAALEFENKRLKRQIDELDAMGFIHADIVDIKAVPDRREWIPVTEQMPDPNVEVLISYERFDGMVAVATAHLYSDLSRWWNTSVEFSYMLSSVYAWMPLPEPYREDGE